MRQMSFSYDIIPTTETCVYRHHVDDYSPFCGTWNYGKLIHRVLRGYTTDNNIDYIISNSLDETKLFEMRGNKYNRQQFEQIYFLLKKYKKVYITSGHALLNKRIPSIMGIVESCNNTPYSIGIPHPLLVYNSDENSVDIQDNVIAYHYHNVIEDSSNSDMYLRFAKGNSMNHDQFLHNNRNGNTPTNHFRTYSMDSIVRQLIQTHPNNYLQELLKVINNGAFECKGIPFNIHYFDGCGVGGGMWRLRPLMIKEVLKTNIKDLYWI